MKKTLIAAAVAAAVAAPAANAGVVVYGQIHNSIDYVNSVANNPAPVIGRPKMWQVQSRASRLGFKGSEDLGNGLKAIWKIEMNYDTANGPAVAAGTSRNTYVGLAGDWGTFLVGRHDTPYKMAFYSTGIDMMGDTIADANTMYGYHEVRASNAIAYVSPNMNGLTAAVAIVPGENSPAGTGLADLWSLGLMYNNNGIKAALGYEVLDGIGFVTNKKYFGGIGYSMNAFDVALGYQNHDLGAVNNLKTWSLAAGYTFGNNKVMASYGKVDLGAISWTGYSVGAEHNFSKRTKIYGAYADSEFGLNGTVGGANFFPGTQISNTALVSAFSGRNAKAVSVGIIHKF
jgi:predicted porin